jgi:hypothetical protein
MRTGSPRQCSDLEDLDNSKFHKYVTSVRPTRLGENSDLEGMRSTLRVGIYDSQCASDVIVSYL